MTTGERIKAARNKAGLKQSELAEKLGVAVITIGQYERDKRQPRIDQLIEVAKALNVSVDYLLGVPSDTPKLNIVGENSSNLLPNEFNEFERFIETLGYYTRLDGDNYRLHKGRASVVVTPDELKALVRASRATVAALVQDLMESATPPPDASQEPSEGE